MIKEDLHDRLAVLKDELDEVLRMTEDEVCEAYNTDDKNEIVEDIQEEIKDVEDEIRISESESDWVDPGFEDEADYLRYKFG